MVNSYLLNLWVFRYSVYELYSAPRKAKMSSRASLAVVWCLSLFGAHSITSKPIPIIFLRQLVTPQRRWSHDRGQQTQPKYGHCDFQLFS